MPLWHVQVMVLLSFLDGVNNKALPSICAPVKVAAKVPSSGLIVIDLICAGSGVV